MRWTTRWRPAAGVACVLLALAAGPALRKASALDFNFSVAAGSDLDNLLSGTSAEQQLGTQVINGFIEGGELWSSRFSDPITVNITIDFLELDPGILGSAAVGTGVFFYSSVRDALGIDATTADDATAVANLQQGPALDFVTSDTSNPANATRIRDNDTLGVAANNNRFLDVPRANAKALGLTLTDPSAADAAIGFNSAFNWDFDRSDGVTGGFNTFDFVGVAAHEIGHALGFISGVDIVDLTAEPAGPFAPLGLQEFAVFSVTDLFRYTAASLAEPNQPAAGGVLDLAVGQPSAGDRPFFSIDGGATGLATFATGRFNGEGLQASHWQDNLGLGIMDPTFAPLQLGVVTPLDLRALDVIGYDPVPEPTALGLFAVTAPLLLAGRQRAA